MSNTQNDELTMRGHREMLVVDIFGLVQDHPCETARSHNGQYAGRHAAYRSFRDYMPYQNAFWIMKQAGWL